MINLVILGVTGSIGQSALEVCRQHSDKIKIVGMTANNSWESLVEAAQEFRPEIVAFGQQEAADKFANEIKNVKVLCGTEGIDQVATYDKADTILSAIVGGAGLSSTYKAVQTGKRLALANKEPLVMAGQIIMDEAKKSGSEILPVDSEHNAIFQCLRSGKSQEVKRLILTASGGPFRELPADEFSNISVEKALKHPTWNMGAKITIDSATLMNKALEIIEARWLFDVPFEKIDVMVHPQSVIHSMVEYIDGSVVAQMGVPDMKGPIQYALTYPDRIDASVGFPNFIEIGKFEFYKPRHDVFPTLKMAHEVGNTGGTAPAAFNAANEEAVAAFLDKKIGFSDIFKCLRHIIENHKTVQTPSLEDIFETDKSTRLKTKRYIEEL